jgi:hypothetical protein
VKHGRSVKREFALITRGAHARKTEWDRHDWTRRPG